MFDSTRTPGAGGTVPLSSADLLAVVSTLAVPTEGLDDAARIERIHRIEQAKAALAAAQAVEVASFVASRRAVAAEEIAAVRRPGVGKRRRLAEAERGIVTDVAVARRESPAQARWFIGFATTAPDELAQSFRSMARGEVSERKLLTLHRATTWLEPAQRRTVDTHVAAHLAGWGDRQVLTEAQAAGYRLDRKGSCARAARAAADRCVSVRPAPETMTRLSALLPLPQGVAVFAALDRAVTAAKAGGDSRSRGQIMADTLVERVTGQATAAAVPVAIKLVMTDQTLLGRGSGADEPARIIGGLGWLPAAMTRDLVLGPPCTSTAGTSTAGTSNAGDDTTTVAGARDPVATSVQRLFTDPAGRLVAMESRARLFTPAMAEFVRIRDDVCRTPWCDAPVRQIDHVDPATHGGPTTVTNGRGLCAHCNLAAQASGTVSRARVDASGAHTVVTRTPMGQVLRSQPPDLPGAAEARRPRSTTHGATVIDLWWPEASAA